MTRGAFASLVNMLKYALCLTTNALCRTAEIDALLLKCVLIAYILPENV